MKNSECKSMDVKIKFREELVQRVNNEFNLWRFSYLFRIQLDIGIRSLMIDNWVGSLDGYYWYICYLKLWEQIFVC